MAALNTPEPYGPADSPGNSEPPGPGDPPGPGNPPGDTGPPHRLTARLAGWLPWRGRPRARDLLCLAAIAASGIYTVATIPLTPALIATRPVLLVLLTGSTSSVVAAGAFSDVDTKLHLALIFVVAVAVPGMMRFDWVFWWAGKLWGRHIVGRLGQRSPRAAALAGVVKRRGIRFAGPLVAISAFLPVGVSTAVYAAAGWAGLSLVPFLVFDAIGTAAWTSLLAWAGYLLGEEGVTLANLVSRYALITMCVLAAGTIAPHAWSAWRQRSRPKPAVPQGPSPSSGNFPPRPQ